MATYAVAETSYELYSSFKRSGEKNIKLPSASMPLFKKSRPAAEAVNGFPTSVSEPNHESLQDKDSDLTPFTPDDKSERRDSDLLAQLPQGKFDTTGISDEDVIIRSGADASLHLLSLRDDGDPVLTFRSIVLGTAFACFQAAMNQIYNVGARWTGLTRSLNPPMRPFPELSSSSSSTSSAKDGLSSSPEVTTSHLDGEKRTLESSDSQCILPLPNSSIHTTLASKSIPSLPLPLQVRLKDLSASSLLQYKGCFTKTIRSMPPLSFSVSFQSPSLVTG